MHSFKEAQSVRPEIEFLYLHKFFYGGVTTFTAHLIYNMGLIREDHIMQPVLHPAMKSERNLRDFGYGLRYKNISVKLLRYTKFPFITVVKDNYYHALKEFSDAGTKPVIVIHDPRDISERVVSLIKTWKVITIRKTVQKYLEMKHNIRSLFLYHPFFPYYTPNYSNLSTYNQFARKGAVSISRIGFGKNIDLILKANSVLESYNHGCNAKSDTIRIYGCPTPRYVYLFLDHKRVNKNTSTKDCNNDAFINGDFRRYYYGKFERSFSAISEILSQRKFVVDLSTINNDGGGTQYTFLEAIHNGCALILHRKWLEGIYSDPEYCDFKEGYNCFAVDDEYELAELIKSDPDTRKVNENARKLMYRHYNVDWSQMIENYN